jgi:hypothetical protein
VKRIIAAGVVLVLALVAGAAAARASCPADAAERGAKLRERLDRERAAARRWRWGWAAGFGAATALQAAGVLAEYTPTGDFDESAETSLTVGAIKSAIGMTARIVAPIKVPRPAVTGDACADLAAAEAAMARAAFSEKKSFWLNHVGGLALHAGGTLYIGLTVDDAWGDAAISFGLGWTVGLISTYTQPRGVWKEVRVAPMVAPGAQGLSIAGSF